MKRLILINGFPGTGKTTVSRKLYEELNDGALIDTDYLMHGRPWKADKMFKIALENGIMAARNFYTKGFDTVILAGCVHTKELFTLVRDSFAGECNILFVQLFVDDSVRKERMGNRYEPLKSFLFTDDIHPAQFLEIDTGKNSIEEVIQAIWKYL